VLGIGLAINVPRVVLYFQLVPIYGGYGAALSFLTGAVTGLCVAIVVSKKIHFGVSFRKISIAIIVPFTAAITCYLVGLGWLIGGAVILLACTLFYGRLGVVERSDLSEIARAFASEKTVAKLGERLSKLLKIIYGE
jgi:O-antigen/teichoic acid export membrane protein